MTGKRETGMKESKIWTKRGFFQKAGPTVAGAILSAIGYA